MVLPGRIAYARGILSNIRCAKTQVQPCGIDLSLKRVLILQSSGCIDFDNSRRQSAASAVVPFDPDGDAKDKQQKDIFHAEGTRVPWQYQSTSLHLNPGVYLVEFNEQIRMPLNIMGQLFVRSSLFRSGAQIHAGVVDSGYEGVIGAMLSVENPSGLRLHKDARLAQMVFHEMTEPTEGYSGRYQQSEKL